MQLSFVTQFNEADRLQWSGLQLLSQPTGLTASAATKPRAPARSHRAAASVAWVFVILSLTSHNGVMAVAVRQQPQVPPVAKHAMQPASGQVDIPKRHTALLSTQKKHATTQEASVEPVASSVPEFFQLDSDIENTSSSDFPSVPEALLESNLTSAYSMEILNASDPDLEHGSPKDKQQFEKTSVWPWIRLGKVVRKSNHAVDADKDMNVSLREDHGAASQKGVSREQPPDAVRAFFAKMRQRVMPDRRFMALPLGIAFLAITAFVCLYFFLSWRFGQTSGVRMQVEALRVSTGHDIKELFQLKERYDCCHFQPLSPGLVHRLQGTVTAGRQGKLVAPLSKRECVHFSASASTKRHDGIHALPVAFHSVCVDFTLALLDAPDVQVTICGQDVALFDSKMCVTEDQRRFSDSPDHWQDFILTHRAPGATGVSSAALRSDSGSLEFREVALATGSIVTCMGELRQGHDGVLRLFPCGEIGVQRPSDDTKLGKFGDTWRTSWEKPETITSMKTPEKVLISDDKSLLKTPRKGWGYLNCHASRKDDVLDDHQEDA
eukprot:gnl/MRDRNA2_/MRDRNA2_67786_c0_seq1.p1 gnl/MRDRNA2_/MRDRNA2_67786_c0~~gnl/MRDRNA2_/MRDRNA2_67786_c0_seq1.p1  ORF type:complete len:551 (-),score=85.07 gnl/MRDRNA2_/MRDRNA2_67786_c0_seq1:120-1772(-)